MDLSILTNLGIVDCAILLRIEENTFTLEGGGSDWLPILLPHSTNQDTIDLSQDSLFLADFLIDAESFWLSDNKNGQINSGIWTEQINSKNLYLEAIASKLNGDCYLLIKNAETAYAERKETLQIARELSISNDGIVERHDYLSDRLRSLLIDNANNDNRLPLHEAIRYATIGVVITDDKLIVQDINPCAFEIFEQPEHINHNRILVELKNLINRQYPEKSIFSGAKAWHGEVFWHTPPQSSKWLKVSVHPILNSTGGIAYWIISFSDQSRIKHLLQTNEELALHDPLTGLPNRQYFWQELQTRVTRRSPFYLINIDIVNFKNINEVYGYLAGDELLKQISARIANELHEHDFITRMGADEFMIIRHCNDDQLRFNEVSFEEDTIELANSLNMVCEQALYTNEQRRCELSVKIGLTHFPNDSLKPEELLNFADLALTVAKTKSSNGIELFNDRIKLASSRRLMLEEALRGAIENNELELHLQPIYNINTQQLIKAEALLRWTHNDELIMPSEFIPIAENSDMINVLGRWVIARTCEIIKQLDAHQIRVPISVNFSPRQIYDSNLIGFIQASIDSMGIAPALMDLEVTEGVLIKSYERVSSFLHELKRIGLSISVDDFGTGYSSLAYLKHLPIDTLKIDRSFIIDLAIEDDDSSAIVSAILALAQKLNLNVIAEGIETQAQEKALISQNCIGAQGFLYSRPLALDKFIDFAKRKN